jgi:hypothetical protein
MKAIVGLVWGIVAFLALHLRPANDGSFAADFAISGCRRRIGFQCACHPLR